MLKLGHIHVTGGQARKLDGRFGRPVDESKGAFSSTFHFLGYNTGLNAKLDKWKMRWRVE